MTFTTASFPSPFAFAQDKLRPSGEVEGPSTSLGMDGFGGELTP